MLVAVSRTKSVGLRGQDMWVYDASLSLVLAEVIRAVESLPAADRPAWWPATEHTLRVHAVVSDLHLSLDLDLTGDQREELAQLLDGAAERLRRRQAFTAAEAADWKVLDEHTVIFRGREPAPTKPAAQLAEALAHLIRGTLPTPPPGFWWFYGPPGGRSLIRMRSSHGG